MAVTSRIHSPPAARGLLRASPPRIIPLDRAPRRLAPGVRAVSGVPGPGGSPVPRRPPSALSSASSAIDFLTLCHRLKVQLYVLVMIWRLPLWWYIATRHAFPAILVFSMWHVLCGQCNDTSVLNIIRNSEKLIKRRQNQLH
jgi:hypothetical protein